MNKANMSLFLLVMSGTAFITSFFTPLLAFVVAVITLIGWACMPFYPNR